MRVVQAVAHAPQRVKDRQRLALQEVQGRILGDERKVVEELLLGQGVSFDEGST